MVQFARNALAHAAALWVAVSFSSVTGNALEKYSLALHERDTPITLYRTYDVTGRVLILDSCPVCPSSSGPAAAAVAQSAVSPSGNKPSTGSSAISKPAAAGDQSDTNSSNKPGIVVSSSVSDSVIQSPSGPQFIRVTVNVVVDVNTSTTILPNGSTSTVTVTQTATFTSSTTITQANGNGNGGGAGVAPGQTSLPAATSSGPLFLNTTSASSMVSPSSTRLVVSSPLSMSVSATASSLLSVSSSSSSPTSDSSSTSTTAVSTSSSATPSIDVLAVLRAAAATGFCSSLLSYTQSTLTQTSVVVSTISSETSLTSTIQSTTTSTTTFAETIIETSSSTVVITEPVTATETSLTTTSIIATFSSTSTFGLLRRRQAIAQPTGLGNAPIASISAACSILVGAPTDSTAIITAISTTSQTAIVSASETSISTVIESTTQTLTSTTTTETSTTATTTVSTSTAVNTISLSSTSTVVSVFTPVTTIGQIATPAPNVNTQGGYRGCTGGSSWLVFQRASTGLSYTIPRDGIITTAQSLDASVGAMQFRVYRLVSGTTYSLVGSSATLTFTGSNMAINYVFAPFQVLAGDILGLFTDGSDGPCAINSNSNSIRYANSNVGPVGASGSFGTTIPGYLLNIRAILV